MTNYSRLQQASALPLDQVLEQTIGKVFQLAVNHHKSGQIQGAEDLYRAILQIQPNHLEANHNMELLAIQTQRPHAGLPPQAEPPLKPTRSGKSAKRKALPKDLGRGPSAKEINSMVALYGQGRTTEVETLARSLTMRLPLHGFGWKILGAVLQIQGCVEEASLCMQEAVRLMPEDAEAHSNLAHNLKDQGRLTDAEASLRQALTLKPDYADAHNNLGLILQDQGQNTEAMKSYRQALEIQADHAATHSNLLFCLSHDLSVESTQLYAEHLAFGEQFEAPLRAGWQPHNNGKNPARCLQVGFVSGDLRNHAVASFLEPVLEFLSKKQALSLHAYYTHSLEDAVTQRLRAHFSHWNSVVGLSDAAMAEKIRADGIDILIDLSGHTAHNRLLTFAHKPAPIQASWMGYPGTTGLQAMDYYLTDRFFLPPGQFEHQFTEKLVRLPANAPFVPSADAPSVNVLPALANGYVTFGSFNRPNKLSRTVIALWSQLLRALPDARMRLGAMTGDGNNDTLTDWFAQEGIVRERLCFHPRSDMQAYLALHHQVDVCLDTFPYAGGTTTLHALWMGVPTLTLAGTTVAGRTGAGILGHAELDAFVAQDAAAFVQQGLSLVADLSSLANQRSELRKRFSQSAPGQPEVIAAGLERALRAMWQRWCAGLPTESFEMNHASVQNMHNAMQEAKT